METLGTLVPQILVSYNFKDRKNCAFTQLCNGMDNVCHTLQAEGIGTNSQYISILTKEGGNCLWKSGALGLETPNALFGAA